MSKAEQPRGPQSVPSGESSPRQLSPDRSRVILHPTDFTPTSYAAFAHALLPGDYRPAWEALSPEWAMSRQVRSGVGEGWRCAAACAPYRYILHLQHQGGLASC